MSYLRYLCWFAHSGVHHKRVVFFVLFVTVLCFVWPMLPISLDCPFLIAPSVLSNVYFQIIFASIYCIVFVFVFLFSFVFVFFFQFNLFKTYFNFFSLGDFFTELRRTRGHFSHDHFSHFSHRVKNVHVYANKIMM